MTQPIEDLIVGESRVIRELRATILRVAPMELPVAIIGPTGSGKELVARALHAYSGRRGEFVATNVCAIGESMFESTFFGHKRGAFTGAVSDSAGLFREADGGTCFLDEISGLPFSQQAKLLRAVETKCFRPVGAPRDVETSFRVVCASNEDLPSLVASGRFREDLWFRMGAMVIRTPPLSERREDIPVLVGRWLRDAGRPADLIAEEAIELLKRLTLQGNVRQLQYQVALLLAQIDAGFGRSDVTALCKQLERGSESQLPSDSRRQAVLGLLEEHSWRVSDASRALGCHQSTLYRELLRLGISSPRQMRAGSGRRTGQEGDAQSSFQLRRRS